MTTNNKKTKNGVVVNTEGPTFSDRVLEAALSIPKGRVTSYGNIACAAGAHPIAAQSIGTILSRAEKKGAKNIPWHRIVYANGTVWINEEYRTKRMKLYKKEKIEVNEKGKILNFRDILYTF